LLKLGCNFVNALSFKPRIRPFREINHVGTIWAFFIPALLHGVNEILADGVAPSIVAEVDLESSSKSVPRHEEDKLLN